MYHSILEGYTVAIDDNYTIIHTIGVSVFFFFLMKLKEMEESIWMMHAELITQDHNIFWSGSTCKKRALP